MYTQKYFFPSKRVMKYSLLLEQIIKYTKADDKSLCNLIKAKEGMDLVAESINESKRRKDLVDSIIKERKKIKHIFRPSLLTTISISTITGIEPFDRLRISLFSLKRLPMVLRASVLEMKNFMICGDRLSQCFKRVYGFEACRIPGEDEQNDEEIRETLKALNKFQELVFRAGIRGPIKYLVSNTLKSL
ncbi:hypothetical protein BY996DRAFT_763097 [Phakopsora pachyrhizi]|nr:hypothetical protein BY996DRAFT_763097 [Phakopsora pachyrhizi]